MRDKKGRTATKVEQALRNAGVSFESEPRVGGLRPDFLVKARDGRNIILEVKSWPGDRRSVVRAKKQAALYRKATGADLAYVILAERPKGSRPPGVLSVSDLGSFLSRRILRTPAGSRRRSRPKAKFKAKRATAVTRRLRRRPRLAVTRAKDLQRAKGLRGDTVFAAMPFSEEFDDVYLVAIADAAKHSGMTCVRVDREEFEGDIVEEIKRQIRESAAVIADLTDANPNVMYEVGYAHGVDRPFVLICRSPLSKLPLDIRNSNILSYKAGRTHHLRAELRRRLKAALA